MSAYSSKRDPHRQAPRNVMESNRQDEQNTPPPFGVETLGFVNRESQMQVRQEQIDQANEYAACQESYRRRQPDGTVARFAGYLDSWR